MYQSKQIIQNIKTSLKISTVEGMAYGAFLGFGNNYILAYAITLQTDSLQFGILCSLPGFFASFAQLFDNKLVLFMGSRKKVAVTFALLQALMLVPIIALAIWPIANRSWLLILFAVILTTFGSLITPVWGSIMSEIVPDRIRGKYFSRRGSISSLVSITTFLLAGIILTLGAKKLWGFVIIFSLATVSRLISSFLLTRLYELPNKEIVMRLRTRPGIFFRMLFSTNLGKYMIFLFAMSFVVNISSPYLTRYQLHDLRFNYLTFAVLEIIAQFTAIITMLHWGKAADRFGNWKIVRLTAVLIPFSPMLWIVSSNISFLVFAQIFSGLVWAGFNLCTVNYLYDATTPKNRTRYLIYFNAGHGLAAGSGALLGSYLIPGLPFINGYQILTLCLISGILRLLVALVFIKQIQEVRKVSKFSATQLFYILTGGRPLARRITLHRTHIIHFKQPPVRKLQKLDSMYYYKPPPGRLKKYLGHH